MIFFITSDRPFKQENEEVKMENLLLDDSVKNSYFGFKIKTILSNNFQDVNTELEKNITFWEFNRLEKALLTISIIMLEEKEKLLKTEKKFKQYSDDEKFDLESEIMRCEEWYSMAQTELWNNVSLRLNIELLEDYHFEARKNFTFIVASNANPIPIEALFTILTDESTQH